MAAAIVVVRGGRRPEALPVVGHLQDPAGREVIRGRLIARADAHVMGRRVLAHVPQGLLGDPQHDRLTSLVEELVRCGQVQFDGRPAPARQLGHQLAEARSSPCSSSNGGRSWLMNLRRSPSSLRSWSRRARSSAGTWSGCISRARPMMSTWKMALARAWAGPSWISWARRARSASCSSGSAGAPPDPSPGGAVRPRRPAQETAVRVEPAQGRLQAGYGGLVGDAAEQLAHARGRLGQDVHGLPVKVAHGTHPAVRSIR